MKNKKGFTLVELLAVVLLVALLMLIGIPAIMRYMKQGTRSYYRSLEKEMEVAGMDYMESYRTLLPRQIDHVSVVELEELVDNKYIDPVVDEKGNACTGQVAVKKQKNNKYEYHSCLICGEYYSSEKQECDFDESKNEYADSEDYRIVVDPKEYNVAQMEEFTSPYAEVYYNDQLIKDDLEGKPKKVDTSKVGTYEVKYYYHGKSEKIKVNVLDVTNPSATQVVLKYDNESGKNYKGNWYNGPIYAGYKSIDYTKKGYIGSDIDHYEVSTDARNYVPIEGNSEILTQEGEYARYVRALDKAGNQGDESSYILKIDVTKPTVTEFKVTSSESGFNAIKININISGSDALSGVGNICFLVDKNDYKKCDWKTPTNNSYSDTYTFDESDYVSGTTHTIYAFVRDKAGNVTSQSKTYTVYKYCSEKTFIKYGSWGKCSASCGGGKQTRTVFYNDKYITSHACNITGSQKCNTQSCPPPPAPDPGNGGGSDDNGGGGGGGQQCCTGGPSGNMYTGTPDYGCTCKGNWIGCGNGSTCCC